MTGIVTGFRLYVTGLFVMMVFAIIMPAACFGQMPDDFPQIDTEVIGGKTLSEKSYSKESLFGYMNGGAELYLEYGFDRLVVTEIVAGESEFKAEIYKMNGEDEAFGIYSVSVFRCAVADLLTNYYCQTDYQVQFCKGDYYVNIINASGSKDGLRIAVEMALNLIDVITGDLFSISAYLPEVDNISAFDKVILISGDIALGNNAYELSALLKGFNDYKALIAKGEGETLISVMFEAVDEQIRFLDSLGVNHNPPANKEIELDNGMLLTVTFANKIIIRSVNN